MFRSFLSAGTGRRAWKGAVGIFAAALLILATPFALAEGIVADHFTSNGDQISGWYWLRDEAGNQYAEYTWNNPPKTGDIVLEVTVLATDRVSGGPGVHAHFDLLVGWPGSGQMGGVFKKIGLGVQNVGDSGAGYTCHSYYTLDRDLLDDVMPANGQLFIRVERGSARGPHVAFRADSFKIVSEQDLRDDLLGDLLGDLTDDGTTLGDLLGNLSDGGGATLDLDTLQDLLDLLEQGGGDIVIDQRGGGLTEDQLRDLLDQLLDRDGDIVIDRRDGGLSEGDLRILLELLLKGGGTIQTDRSGGETEMNLELGDWGDEGMCLLDRPCIGDAASGFRSTGFPGVEGWFWLRSPTVGQYADWVFEQPPAGGLVLDISGLAQNIPGHVQKDTAHVLMTLGYPGSGSLGGQIGPFTVALPMIWEDPETDIWKTRALVTIPPDLASSVIPITGGLYVHIERVDEHEPDVGFSAGSVLVYPAQAIGR